MISTTPDHTPTNSPILRTPTSRRRFLPTRSSPLSSPYQPPTPSRPASASFCTLPSPPRSPNFLSPYRTAKPTPLSRSREENRNARRDLFLKKVKGNRDDKMMKARGGEEEMMRMIFVAEQKRWRASLARAASRIPTIYEEEEVQEPDWVQTPDSIEDEYGQLDVYASSQDDLDEFLDRDGAELDALMAQMDIGMMDVDTVYRDPHYQETSRGEV